MYRRLTRLPAIAACALVVGCVIPMPAPPTPLEIQSLQSREYEASKEVVFASVMSVFQDLGYIVTSADLATGFITTESVATSEGGFLDFLLRTSQMTQTRATATVEKIGDRTRVRLNFVATWQQSTAEGQTTRHDEAVLEPTVYENAFDRIENAIFVRS